MQQKYKILGSSWCLWPYLCLSPIIIWAWRQRPFHFMLWMRLSWFMCRVKMRNSSSRSWIKMNWKLHRSSYKSSAITHNSLCHLCTPATFYLPATSTNQLMLISPYVPYCSFDHSDGQKFELLLAFVMLILWSLSIIKWTLNMSSNSKTSAITYGAVLFANPLDWVLGQISTHILFATIVNNFLRDNGHTNRNILMF